METYKITDKNFLSYVLTAGKPGCFLLVVLILSFSCANQGFPPGGPVDRIPPQIISTIPEANSLNVSRKTQVEIEFSEKLDPRSVNSAIFISPNPGDRFEIESKGEKLQIEFLDSLVADVTYTITFGVEIKDLRGNKLVQSYTLAFSTGNRLDQNQISGKIYGEKPNELSVWAYYLTPGIVVDPTQTKPQYITQCSNDGVFQFSNLAPRSYRLYAILDRNRNQTYQIGQETIGLTSSDIYFADGEMIVQNKLFRMTKVDTNKVRLLQIEQPDNSHIRLRFSRVVFPPDSLPNYITMIGRDGESKKILDIVPDQDNRSIWSLTTTTRDTGSFKLTIYNLFDQNKELIADSLTINFAGFADPDTSRPRLFKKTPEDSSQLVLPNSSFKFNFTESLDSSSSNTFAAIYEDSILVNNYSLKWNNLTEFEIIPDSTWTGLHWYSCVLDTTKIFDLAGNQIKLNKNSFSWRIVDPDTLCSISGRIEDEDSLARSIIFLELLQSGEKKPISNIALPDTGFYQFSGIFPGNYIVQGFRDSDGNGLYSYGKVNPFVPAERFFVAQDTIPVQPRWPNEGNDYRIRK